MRELGSETQRTWATGDGAPGLWFYPEDLTCQRLTAPSFPLVHMQSVSGNGLLGNADSALPLILLQTSFVELGVWGLCLPLLVSGFPCGSLCAVLPTSSLLSQTKWKQVVRTQNSGSLGPWSTTDSSPEMNSEGHRFQWATSLNIAFHQVNIKALHLISALFLSWLCCFISQAGRDY